MANKKEKPTVTVVDPHLGDVINEYLDAKRVKESAEKKMNDCLSEIETYTGIDKDSPYEGKVVVRSGNVDVEVEYKLNYKVDKEIALQGCSALGVDPMMLFNVDLKYSKPKVERLTDEEKEVVAAATTTSRGKSGIKFN